MTIYSERMKNRLEANRKEVETIQKAEYLYGKMTKVVEMVEQVGGQVHISDWSNTATIKSMYTSKKKISMKTIKIILDETIFTDDRLEINAHDSGSYYYIDLVDKNTGGKLSITVAMDSVECKRVEVGRKTRIVEDIEYKYECE